MMHIAIQEQLDGKAVDWAVSVQLTLDEIRHLEEAYQPHPVLGYA